MRRTSLSLLALLTVLVMADRACADLATDWSDYKSRFLSPEGRIVDTGQDGISHSEGQAFGMLLAVELDDREGFDRLWTWTREHLRVRDDGLCAWKWVPGRGIADRNNASDGDLIMAWALWRAAESWGESGYAVEARKIAQALKTTVVRVTAHGTVLLPGADGFLHDGLATANLSYWVFPALQALSRADPDPAWPALIDSGIRLLENARFGRWELPPDWLQLSDPLSPAPDRPVRFGYDAIRIPLYLIWAGLGNDQRLRPYRAYLEYFQGASFLSPWTNLEDDSISSWDAPRGIHAVLALASGRELPVADSHADYYPASLYLMSRIARREMQNP
jgi:endoglucanase